MELRRFLAIITMAMVIILIIVIWFFPSDEDFRTENPFWNGTQDMSISYPTTPMKSLSELALAPKGSTLILIPYLEFTTVELVEVKDFVIQGGTLILADDYGYGNQVLGHLELKARFSGKTLLDPLSNYKNKWFPRVPHLKPGPFTSNTDNLVFNHATCLKNVEADDVLAQSSLFSFLDLNDNQSWDDGEPTGPLPVISQHKLGSGQVVLLPDPSIFINSMEGMGGNNNFIENIAATTSNLLIDQSHLPPSNLHQSKNLLGHIHGFLVTPSGTSGLVIVVLIITLRPIWHKKKDNSGGGSSP